ncbi:hypothetical protein Sango_2729400 [Sesamum angolense]|uniref:Uncharacterized protein n=1 Tax=Sesamum angolense TaxID=2727404 RepID=A0AAE1VYR8_9LAMI|nr:hypothetical protein Sango_2729400 [Sesamum angolense]
MTRTVVRTVRVKVCSQFHNAPYGAPGSTRLLSIWCGPICTRGAPSPGQSGMMRDQEIPFFEQTFPEIPADSVDVPNLRYAKFYNKSEGRLDKGMLFKTKEELMEAVQDHSIRHACREYYVTESSKTKWKVLCKHSTEGSLLASWLEYQLRKFNRIMEEIKKQDVKAFAYLDQINKEKWTASHDGGWRCGILTTNMSECINGVLKGARRLPVSALVEITLERTVHYFRVRAIKGQKMLQNNQLWTDFACKMFISWQQKAVEHTVTKYSHAQQSASVVTRRQNRHGMNPCCQNCQPRMLMRQVESIWHPLFSRSKIGRLLG